MYDNKRLHEQYVLTNGIFDCVESKVKVDIHRGKYPYTQQALYYGSKKIDTILKSLLNQQAPELYYVNYILIRALFEHYLVAYYISVKAEYEFMDKAGREYYHEYMFSEYIKRVSYDITIDDITNKVLKRDVFEEFKRQQSDYQNMTSQQKDEIHRTANQFDIKVIIRYLLHSENQRPDAKAFHDVLPILLKVYNMASSYVHGGASAEAETFDYLNDEMKMQRMNSYAYYAKIISYSIKQRLLTILINVSTEYSNIMKPIEMFLLNRYSVNYNPIVKYRVKSKV